jgi:hypothetical protein
MQKLPQEVPDDCFISQGIHTLFLPCLVLPAGEGRPQDSQAAMHWEKRTLLDKAHGSLSPHIPFPVRPLSLHFVHTRYSQEGRNVVEMWQQ